MSAADNDERARRPSCAGLLLAAIAIFACLATFGWFGQAPRATPAATFFAQTGHGVREPFAGYFEANGGEATFGAPISDQLRDPASGVLMQYFSHARMEYDPRNPLAGVRLANLGEAMRRADPPLAPRQVEPDTPYQRYFPVTGHTSSYAFLAVFNQRGGAEIFGYPISEPIQENGYLVQYFQRARMEWRPDNPANERVVLAPLGSMYAAEFLPAAALLPGVDNAGPQWSAITPTPVLRQIRLLAGVLDPIARQGGTQTVFAQVTDETGEPVEGAQVQFIVRSQVAAHGYSGLLSDARGLAKVTFPLPLDPPGSTVVVEASATYGDGLSATAQTSYVPWWSGK
jgi:hypothetical protein